MNIWFKGAFNLFNFGDDLLLIATIEQLKKTPDISINDLYISAYNHSINKLKYKHSSDLKDAYEIEDLFNNAKSLIKGSSKQLLTKPLLILTFGMLVLAVVMLKIFKKPIFFKKYLNFIRNVDIVYFVGGGYFMKKWKRTLFYSLLNIFFAKLINPKIKVIGTGMGIGPFDKTSFVLFKKLIRYFNFIAVREAKSYDLLNELNFKNRQLCGDDVSLLYSSHFKKHSPDVKQIGINIKSFSDHNYDTIVNKFQDIFKLFNQNGYSIRFCLFGEDPGPDDEKVTRRLINSLNIQNYTIINPYKMGWEAYLNELSSLSAGIGFAYHFNVILTLCNIPVISVYSGDYYKQKISGVMHYLNNDAMIIDMEVFKNTSSSVIYDQLSGAKDNSQHLNYLHQVMVKKYTEIYGKIFI